MSWTVYLSTRYQQKMPRNNRSGGADINFRSVFQDFNMPKFVVYSSLLVFTMLFALKMDQDLSWSWWSVFTPLFIWKGIAGKSWKSAWELITFSVNLSFSEFILFSVWSNHRFNSLVEKTSNSSQRRRIHPVQSHANQFSHSFTTLNVRAVGSR